jgi:hypothetical protein
VERGPETLSLDLPLFDSFLILFNSSFKRHWNGEALPLNHILTVLRALMSRISMPLPNQSILSRRSRKSNK